VDGDAGSFPILPFFFLVEDEAKGKHDFRRRPTWGATAHSVPSTSSGVTPSAIALPMCHM
jgi:hypothetical protein